MTYNQALSRYKTLIAYRLSTIVNSYPTAKEAAIATGVSASTICRLLKGKSTPSKSDMIKLFGEDLREVELPDEDNIEIMQIEAQIKILTNRLAQLKHKD